MSSIFSTVQSHSFWIWIWTLNFKFSLHHTSWNLKDLKFYFSYVQVILCSSKFKIYMCIKFRFVSQRVREFVPPAETLEKTLESNRGRQDAADDNGTLIHAGNSVFYARTESLTSGRGTGDVAPDSGIFHFLGPLRFWFPVSFPSLD